MREIDTDALSLVAPAMGVGNPASATRPTTFDDENLQQVLDVSGLVRRARAGFSGGIWQASIIASHVAAGTINEELDPYQPLGSGGPSGVNGYPDVVPADFDVWVITSRCSISDATNFVAAVLQLDGAPGELGLFNTTAAATAAPTVLAAWDSIFAAFSSTSATVGSSADPRALQPVHIRRVRRGQVLSFVSESDGATAFTATCRVGLALFPIGMGQDVAL